MASSPLEMAEKMKANLKEKTGKDMAGWLKVAKASKLEKHGQITKHLKEQGMTHGYASMVAHEFLNSVPGKVAGPDLLTAQYAGKKEGLKPIHDALMKVATKLGKDVEVTPRKAYVGLRRNRQFAIIQPSTATRVDLGLNLKGTDLAETVEGALELSGKFSDMVSHRIRLESPKDVTADVKRWLKAAYQGS